MGLLIDGYNLLHASGILPRGIGPTTLQRSREALLNFLAESLAPAVIGRTTVVFDAGTSASGRVRSAEHRGIQVRFSAGKADADDLIEELIRADSAPRRLTVVSSDHRIQRAAQRRRAAAIDSDRWLADVWRSRAASPGATGRPSPDTESKPSGGLSQYEVQVWLRRFGIEESIADQGAEESPAQSPGAEPRSPRVSGAGAEKLTPGDGIKRSDKPNPFPPGYAEDLREEE